MDILLFLPLQGSIHQLIKIAVQIIVRQNGRPLLDFLVIINDFVHIDVILIVGIIKNDKLPGHGGHDVFQRSFHYPQKEIGILFRHVQMKA